MAQKSDTLITYNFGNYTRAVETYKVYKKDSVYIRTTLDAKKAITKSETFSDKKLKVLNGEYLEYKDGQVALKGFYHDNEKTGLWTIFNVDGKPKEAKVYNRDKLNGTYTTYWKNGTAKINGNYVDGNKVGEWKILYENGKTALKETYNAKNKLTDSTYLDIDGEPVSKTAVITDPSFPGGLKKFYLYLSRSVRYPADAQQSKTQGRVYLSFWIGKTGKVESVKVISSPSNSLSEEAIRVTQLSPDWIPGTLFGKPMDVAYNIDINFSLR